MRERERKANIPQRLGRPSLKESSPKRIPESERLKMRSETKGSAKADAFWKKFQEQMPFRKGKGQADGRSRKISKKGKV